MTLEANNPVQLNAAQPNPVQPNMSSNLINNAPPEQSNPNTQPVRQKKNKSSKCSSCPFFFLAIIFYVTSLSLFIVWRMSSKLVTKTSEYGFDYVFYEQDHRLLFAAIICTSIASISKLAAWIIFCAGLIRERRAKGTNGCVVGVPLQQQQQQQPQQSWTSPGPVQQVQVQTEGVSERA
ncbi:hypothetical protein E4U21_003046 [Claviceps maximensis]|nr:hypothetical protein E4U21_003046 [Claviceps maximensis]